jgi:preprotein translocase subunit SecG
LIGARARPHDFETADFPLQILVNILLIVNVFVCIALVTVVLIQQSEGGALGMGGGGGPGNFMTARGAGDLLTRITWILAFTFFTLSMALTLLTGRLHGGAGSIVDHINVQSLDLSTPQGAASSTPPAKTAPAASGPPAIQAPTPQAQSPAASSAPADPLAVLGAPVVHTTVPAAPPATPAKK